MIGDLRNPALQELGNLLRGGIHGGHNTSNATVATVASVVTHVQSCNKSPGTLVKLYRATCFISSTADGAQSKNAITRIRTF